MTQATVTVLTTDYSYMYKLTNAVTVHTLLVHDINDILLYKRTVPKPSLPR